jgi:two-component system cell cycle response regulator DivK
MTKILIVEDNEMNRDMLSRRLERKGYEVLLAVDGQQGIDVATASARPDPDGHEPAGDRRLGGDAAPEGRPRLAAHSGHRAHRARHGRRPRKALEAGCDDYDTKPIELPRLLAKIEALLRDALQMMREAPFDLVLLDIMMPDMDGYEVLRHIKSDERLRTSR